MKKEYEFVHYEGDEKVERFVLGSGGKNPLFVIGLNPSIATNEKSDLTISRVKGLVKRSEGLFDSFIMLNLYAQRCTNPNELHETKNEELHTQNIKHILEILSRYEKPSILAAWGGTIKVRKYFLDCLESIQSNTEALKIKWLKIGEFTKGEVGHPRHPSRGFYVALTPFDIDAYIKSLKQKSNTSSLRQKPNKVITDAVSDTTGVT